jgi:chaperonin GroES
MNEYQAPMEETPEDPVGAGINGEVEPANDLRKMVEEINLASSMDDETLRDISSRAKEGFEYDLQSRREWEQNLEEWTKLALQIKEEKTWPWPRASNVKYPMLSTAAMQFSARAYPSLVPSTGNIVKVEVIGKDKTGMKLERAKRVGTFLSYQVLNEMDGWEEDMDKLLMMLPIAGTIFKKTYWCGDTKKNHSELVLPKNLVVNYWAKCLSNAERVSEIIEMAPRLVHYKQKSGVWRDVELGEPTTMYLETQGNVAGKVDGTVPYQIIEQHTYYDMDGDGLEEPYIVTFERSSGEILCIRARFDDSGVLTKEQDGKEVVVGITPIEYYTKFSFIPNPDGGFYDIGFGLLLSPLNESVNTLINQLIDSGTLNNLQGGFLGKGLKLKMGESKFLPGEWKTINSTADDMRKQILPIPTKEPSSVLFQLMGTLITSGKELASVAEIFTGKMPGQNTPATTTMATVEQGMKVFTAVYKRVYRSLKEEFKKLYALNGIYYDQAKYESIVDEPIGLDDFNDTSYDICPGADPSTATQQEKLMKAQGLLELLPTGALDPIKVISRVLEAQEQPNWEDLFVQQVKESGQLPQQPDPKMLEMQMKSQLEQQKIQMQSQAQQHKMELESQNQQVQLAMKAQEHQMEMQHKAKMADLDAAVALHKQKIFMVQEHNNTQALNVENQQKLVHSEQQHQQAMQHQKEVAKSKAQQQQKTSTVAGKSTRSQK